MLIESSADARISLFLFAHQDDEFGVYQTLVDEKNKGRRIVCIYLTDGGFGGVNPQRRNNESIAVLSKFGVLVSDIRFIGADLTIPDGELPTHMLVAGQWIKSYIQKNASLIDTIYVPAWEGGHQDHDALHAITILISSRLRLLERVRQFSLYNAFQCQGPLFNVLRPLSSNGSVERINIPWVSRMAFMRYCLSYPSQLKTWIGLFPFVFFHYIRNGCQLLQVATYDRILQRPHDGLLYYEKRGFFTWENMHRRLADLIDKI